MKFIPELLESRKSNKGANKRLFQRHATCRLVCVAQTKSVQELTVFKKSNFSLWTKLEQDVERRGGERKKEGEGTGENRKELPLCFTGALWRQSAAESFSLPSRPFFFAPVTQPPRVCVVTQ